MVNHPEIKAEYETGSAKQRFAQSQDEKLCFEWTGASIFAQSQDEKLCFEWTGSSIFAQSQDEKLCFEWT
ncbi:hypothetical protein [uncultured Acinetobacter sp.]|uniref:hypothetical protein n=1 Tax=uncultured Acinetobacter sp. TaxID=165433 RepID=UPI0025898E45|nr:hypothetical protein [uncultured Acinetobacter sp.]